MIDAVDSKTHEIGQQFRASLDEPVVVNGVTLLAKGAEVKTKLVDVTQEGRLSGRAAVTLVLTSIEKDGRSIEATSSEVAVAGKSRLKRTGAVVGGAAVVGAIIGGIAGGGAGAALGAAGGAGAGGAYQLFKKGPALKIPAETRLTFILSGPVQLDESSPNQ
jgi:hypothetical protein